MLKMPDITPAQLVAVVGALLAVVAAAGLDISDELQNAIITLVTVLAPIVIVGDAVIRHGRSRALGVPPRPPVDSDQGDGTGV